MKRFYTLLVLMISLSMLSRVEANGIDLFFANSAVNVVGGDTLFSADVMIAAQSSNSQKVGFGKVYFSYNVDAFGQFAGANPSTNVIYNTTDYLLGTMDQNGFFQNYFYVVTGNNLSNSPDRFYVGWDQYICEQCLLEEIDQTPRKLFRIELKYIPGGTQYGPNLCFESDPLYTEQIHKPCGPFTGMSCTPGNTVADCQNYLGAKFNNYSYDCGIVNACGFTTIANSTSNIENFCEDPSGWIHYLNAASELIVSVNPMGNTLGKMTGTVYVTGHPNVFYGSAYLGRSAVITPQYQPSGTAPVFVRNYMRTSEVQELQKAAQMTSTPNDDFINFSDLGLIKYQGPTEDNILDFSDATALDIVTNDGHGLDYNAEYLDFAVFGFSEFWNANPVAVLPLDLTSFEGKTVQDQNILEWLTATEEATDRFDIERSKDGYNYSKIGEVKASGYSTQNRNYLFYDRSPLLKHNYYRLKMIDLDGTFTYSEVVYIKMNFEDILNVYPNPIRSDELSLTLTQQFHNKSALFTITDIRGRIVYQQNHEMEPGTNKIILQVSDIPIGTYFIHVDNNEYSAHKKFIKVEN